MMKRQSLYLTAVIAFAPIILAAHAADVVVQPSSGSGFVVKDANGTNERLRVQESGAVNLPGVVTAPAQSQALCVGTAGQLGPCSGSGSGSNTYGAGAGLSLAGSTFSVAPSYQLPQTCAANQIPLWNGSTAWTCSNPAASGLPAGNPNQTLRYDASSALVANNLLQAFADGGLVAGGAVGSGSIPATGAGARLMWYPAKGAARIGIVTGTQWDTNIGLYSFATGGNTIASGQLSTALGSNTVASGDTSTALGGASSATGDYSTATGFATQASGGGSTAMGVHTHATAESSTATGSSTIASERSATAMGENSVASGFASTAMGQSTASGDTSTAMGHDTIADGKYSTAMGHNVSTGGHAGSFIYGDSVHSGVVSSTRDDQFEVIAHGGFLFDSQNGGGFTVAVPNFYLQTNGGSITSTPDGLNGVTLNSGSGAWTTISDRNAKTAVYPADVRDVLKKVVMLPMNTWQYKTQEAKYRHMGPMAQDFYAAFHLGESDKGIDTVDADGVALAAIQGLNILLAENDAKAVARLNEKDREIAALKTRIASLETLAGDLAEVKSQLAALRTLTANMSVALQQP